MLPGRRAQPLRKPPPVRPPLGKPPLGKPQRDADHTRIRLSVLSTVVVVLFVALFSRLWYLQVLAGDRYGELAEGNRVRQVVIEAPRGRILDREGRVLVDNRAAWAVTVKTSEMGDREDEVLNRLVEVLHMPRAEIDERLDRYTGSPLKGVPVAEDVPPEVLYYLTERQEQFPGVVPAVVALRQYPHGELASHVLGYVGEIAPDQLEDERYRGYRQGDIIGKAGVEMTYDREIRGQDGYQLMEVTADGDVVGVAHTQPPVPGDDLRLSLDLDVQRVAEQALLEGLQEARKLPDTQKGGTYPAPAGTVVVTDVRDGSIVAMASLPQYDPRRFVGGISTKDFKAYNTDPDKPLINRAVQSVYPSGSTFKAIVAMAALRAGVVEPDTTVQCGGSYSLGSYVKHDHNSHGTTDLARSLEQSCNVYYYTIGHKLWQQEQRQAGTNQPVDEHMQDTARAFGLGATPEIDLPFAAGGTIPDRAWRKEFWEGNKDTYCQGTSRLEQELCKEGYRWRAGDNLNVAIGQGDVQISPLQLATAYAALGNDGTVYSPHTAQALLDRDTSTPTRTIKPRVESVVESSPANFAAVREGLVAVTTQGTAASAFEGFPLGRYPVAAKTGTADLNGKSASAWFASYAPANDPQYSIVVMLEEGGHGGQVSAPVARKIYEELFGLQQHEIEAGTDSSG